MLERVKQLVRELGLEPHPEGGFFREFFRSEQSVSRSATGDLRSSLTAIHFLLASGQHSRWHRVASDEQWTFLEGDPLELNIVDNRGPRLTKVRLGPLSSGCEPVTVVPAGQWQAATPLGSYALVTCTVGPGFDFADFRFLADDPKSLELIRPVLRSTVSLL